MNAEAWHGTFVLPPFLSWKLVPCGAGKSVGLYVCLLVSCNVAAVNKWVALYLVKLGLIPLCSVCARSFFCWISVEAETKETWGIYAFFPPKGLTIKNELSLAQAPWKLRISIDVSAPFHCREWDVIITNVMVTNLVVFTVTVATAEIAQHRTKITCQASHYVHPNPACSIHHWAAPGTTLPNGLTDYPCLSVSGHRHPPTAHLSSWHQGPQGLEGFQCLQGKCLAPSARPYSWYRVWRG